MGTQIAMVVIPEPAEGTRTVLVAAHRFPPTPFVTGVGDIDLVCGQCGQVLASKLSQANQVQNMVFRCPLCEQYNETRL